MSNNIKARLYVEHDLMAGGKILLEGNQGYYLANVMHLKAADHILLFNGREGEWLAEITNIGKNRAVVVVEQIVMAQKPEPDLWYLFAPIKKARIDYMVQKATELGVSLIRPVLTARTNFDRLKEDKLRLHAIEAAEQCERFTVPIIEPMIKLTPLLNDWPEDRLLMFCDEEGEGDQNTFPVGRAMDEVAAWQDRPKKWAILIGPEGGFAPEERRLIRSKANVVPVTLGPRILRADTAAIAAIALWQSYAGDWR
ncbi:16S rRNA (uracil(1498)-N(3))-methyltransferase [hydrothermal vent metagenome]|uniref:16S rRNA (uracil(1498)-N(3))-methyltransferase n=1 Tax=hydrothermal vent metagenome TaxID=652676 RepID=A0A3B1ACS5_9ZZZZ